MISPQFVELIRSDSYFSEVSHKPEIQDSFYSLLKSYPAIYGLLETHLQQLLFNASKLNPELHINNIFLSESYSAHLEECINQLESVDCSNIISDFQELLKLAPSASEREDFISFAITIYGKSANFKEATALSIGVLEPLLKEMNDNHIESLCIAHLSNQQCRTRWAKDTIEKFLEEKMSDTIHNLQKRVEFDPFDSD